MKKFIPGTLLVAGLLTAGGFVACHSFSTVRDPTVNGVGQVSIDSNRVSGLVYYLPKGRIRITGDFKSASGDGGGGAAKPGSPAGAKSLAGVPGGPSGGESPEQKNFVVTIAADIEADPKARYYLKPVRNYFYDDTIKLSVNAKHLLSTGNATAEDQTARIISTTASMAAQAAGVPGAGLEAAALILPEKIAVGKLLREIEDAVGDGIVSLDAKLQVSETALEKLEDSLPLATLPKKKQEDVRAVLTAMKVTQSNWFTPRNLRHLLRLFEPEGFDSEIDTSKDPELFKRLQSALTQAAPGTTQPRPFSVVLNPDGPVPDLDACGFKLRVTPQTQPEIKTLKKVWEGKNNDTAYGIAFRTVRPYRVTVDSVPGTWFYIHESRLLLLPDTCHDHTLVLDYSRLAFVKKTTNIAFVDGIPQELAQSAPSSALGFLAIPKGIIQAIVPASPGIIGSPSGVQAPGTSGTTAAPQAAQPSPTPGG